MAPGARPRGRAVTDVLRCRGAHGTVGSWVITVPPGRRHRGLRDVRAPRAVYWHFVHELLLLRHGTVGNAMPQSQLRRPFRSSLIRCARPVIRLRLPLRPPFTDFTRFADRGVWTTRPTYTLWNGCGRDCLVAADDSGNRVPVPAAQRRRWRRRQSRCRRRSRATTPRSVRRRAAGSARVSGRSGTVSSPRECR